MIDTSNLPTGDQGQRFEIRGRRLGGSVISLGFSNSPDGGMVARLARLEASLERDSIVVLDRHVGRQREDTERLLAGPRAGWVF